MGRDTGMKYLSDLFARNRAWAAERTGADPEFFSRLAHLQRPDLLWIGCSDSRVPANEIVGLAPGELFVHRNVANVVPDTDLNAMAVIEYAISSLGVRHVIVCGHYRCGGVRAALEGHQAGAVALWLQPLRNLAEEHRDELDALALRRRALGPALRAERRRAGPGGRAVRGRPERVGARRGPGRPRLDLRPGGRPAPRPRGHPGRRDGRRLVTATVGGHSRRADVALRPWAAGDLRLLQRLLGDPEMTRHLGGPESQEAIRARHERYLVADPEKHGLFAVTAGPAAEAVGWVGYWESEWRGELVWECGWNVLPEAQGRGVATAAAALMIDDARRRGRHRHLHAIQAVGNAASNALCRRLGFELLGEVEVDYPTGVVMRSNDWRLDLVRAEALARHTRGDARSTG